MKNYALVCFLSILLVSCTEVMAEEEAGNELVGYCAFEKGSKDRLPSLVLKPGEKCQLDPQPYELSRMTISKDAELLISPRASRWTVITVKGDVVVAGMITARQFSASKKTVTHRLPNGRLLSWTFLSAAVGGHGGDGADCPPNYTGGKGADGTAAYGGGGGGGAIRNKMHQANGHDAKGRFGGKRWNSGGDGGKADQYRNGGLVFIKVHGAYNGKGGTLDVRGVDGDGGDTAILGESGTKLYCNGASGGGGGGAPGGDAGTIIIEAKNITGYAIRRTQGGFGGFGGRGGVGSGRGDDGGYGEGGEIREVDI